MEYLYEVQRDDLIVNITFAWEGAIAIAQPTDTGALVSHRFPTYVFKQDAAIPDFFRYIILDKQFVYNLGVISPGGAGRNRVLNKNDFLKLRVFLPEVSEQQKIAECLTNLDEMVLAQARKVDALKNHKKGLMRELFPREGETIPLRRFPEFQNAGEWEEGNIGELVSTITPPKKIQTSGYLAEGLFPIVDQSQSFICGWTNDEDAVITNELPLIIFGDHTCALKLLQRPFAQGADGIKILEAKPPISIEFLYQALQVQPLTSDAYRRHFSLLQEKKVCFPMKETGEQEKIVSFLSSLDALITAATQKLEALKTHKKGLMQQLFPSPENQV
jgi:type I restriction enzyme S subunit